MRTLLVLLGGLALAACGGAPEATAPANDVAATDATALNFQTEVAALSPAQRNGVFIRAIRDAGLQCQGVETSVENPPGSFNYAVTCQDGSKHQIAIAASGDAKVTSAAGAR
ncbi:hypothetical protein [Sphingomonas japonica]|uniref:Lipoprotein n=1 Tax=Sphingomonas japonica TaxID=511662 RepID=A0ABX0U0F6_9SPHN|nr:hypothetical protein [Sphingomonas japonica]NIJ24050.1 hypothetical protein [Sphingomonas japonica]